MAATATSLITDTDMSGMELWLPWLRCSATGNPPFWWWRCSPSLSARLRPFSRMQPRFQGHEVVSDVHFLTTAAGDSSDSRDDTGRIAGVASFQPRKSRFPSWHVDACLSVWSGRQKTKRGDKDDLHSQHPSSGWYEHWPEIFNF